VTRQDKRRAVIITGASRGLGKEMALRFGEAGDRVVVNFLSRSQDADAVVSLIAERGGEAIACRADVRNPAHVDAMVHDTVKRWGTVDVLINNAGIVRDALVLRMPEEDWDDVINTNLSGAFHCIRAVSQVMTRQRYGQIISISSFVGDQGREGQANYSASKAGLIGLTKACAKEFGHWHINVNAVLPGYIPTDMGDTVPDAVLDRILRENTLYRISDPKEIAEFVYRLSHMKNVSGQVFNLDSRII
jgi:3-oxoacyl-[acyl-carrier protein] reductase